MGDTAKHRLAALAAQWNERNRTNNTETAAGSRNSAPQETRGLLDAADDDGEEMEMTFAGTGGKKNM